ncbi:hypothetical protein VPH35_051866 [Triticum aestivum]|uniref:F-box domain-containing protein n=1 Tax=Triticum aestivum TaxID=4565 RepID=A0A077RT93_WHEAT|nr:unnamed protein product [Triticum aestivum]
MACETQNVSRLPDEVVMEIFSFLPAKSIGRFRSMSRSWCAELSSPSFVEFHRWRANNPNQPKLFFSANFDDEAAGSEDDNEASDDDEASDDSKDDDEASDDSKDDDQASDDSIDDDEASDFKEGEEASYSKDDKASDSEEDDDEASDSEDEEYYFYSWQPSGGSFNKLMENNFWRPAPLTKPLHGLVLIRSVCVFSHNLGGGYDVCNPSTGEFLHLPDTRLPLKTVERYSTTHGPLPCYSDIAYGFGYCSVTHQYKAVRIFSSPVYIDIATTCCEVLVLGVPTWWRPTAQQPPDCIVEEHNPAVFLNGYLHFLCLDGGIVTFSVNDETFDSLSPPPPYPDTNQEDNALVARMTELDGCLCLCREKSNGDGPYQVWLLRDYEAQQWEQLCSFDRSVWPEPERTQLQTQWITPLTMHNDSSIQRKIMFGTGTCRVFTMDLDGTPEVLLIPDEAMSRSIRDNQNYPAVGLFEESLVLLGRIIQDMDFRSPTTQAWSDVLKWLPAQSVLELSLVCREWRAMALNPQFHQSHVVHANSVKKHHRIKFVIDPSFGVLWDMDGVDNFPYPPDITSDLFHCSRPKRGHLKWHGLLENRSFAARIALGYDSDINDHVLVSLAYEERNMDTRQYKLRCNVRTVYGDQWYENDPPPRPVADSPPAYADGKIYWLVEPKLGPSTTASCELVAFDTVEREFEVVEGPLCSYNNGGRISVVELHGIIHVAWSDQDEDAIDVWVMEDSCAWRVEYRIELAKFSPEYSSESTTIMAIDPTDGRILLNTGRSLGYYNPETGELETIYHVTAESVYNDNRTHFCAVVYQESLFRPFVRE